MRTQRWDRTVRAGMEVDEALGLGPGSPRSCGKSVFSCGTAYPAQGFEVPTSPIVSPLGVCLPLHSVGIGAGGGEQEGKAGPGLGAGGGRRSWTLSEGRGFIQTASECVPVLVLDSG